MKTYWDAFLEEVSDHMVVDELGEVTLAYSSPRRLLKAFWDWCELHRQAALDPKEEKR